MTRKAMLAALLVTTGLAMPAHADPRPWGNGDRYQSRERGDAHRGREVNRDQQRARAQADQRRWSDRERAERAREMQRQNREASRERAERQRERYERERARSEQVRRERERLVRERERANRERERISYERARLERERAAQRQRDRVAAARSDRDWRRWAQYDHYRPDPRYGGYYADRYYRDANYYQPRSLSRNDRIYRGNDGRYYCRRPDGTTGLLIGALGGGVLGNILAPGDSQTIGTLIGGGLGALLGRELERSNVKCR